jgi:thioredoxin reductase
MNSDRYDVVIIGGGASGLSAALVLGRARRRVLVVDAGAPRNAPAAHMQGFLSRDGMPPSELLRTARAEVAGYGVEIVTDRVIEAAAGFTLRLQNDRNVTAKHVLLATGAVDVLPDLPGARERWGRDFLHCPYCHGWEVRDQRIGVLGIGPGSVEHAHLLRQWSDDVAFFANDTDVTPHERSALHARGVTVVDGPVERLVVVGDRLTGVQLADGRSVPRDVLFIRPALRAHSDVLTSALGCEVDDAGLLLVDAAGATNVPGVWAAGNATNPRAQVITAAGEGSAVAIAINTALVQHDIAEAATVATA